MKLAELLGSFSGQVTEGAIKEIEILFDGVCAEMNTRALMSAAQAGIMAPLIGDVNMVSAPMKMKDKGIKVSEVKRDKSGIYDGYIKITITTENQTRSVAGTVFADGKPRLIQIKGINLDAEIGEHMLYTTNKDAPGIIGLLGKHFGDAGVNIANFHLGRNAPGGDAIALLYLDDPIPASLWSVVKEEDAIIQAKPLNFAI